MSESWVRRWSECPRTTRTMQAKRALSQNGTRRRTRGAPAPPAAAAPGAGDAAAAAVLDGSVMTRGHHILGSRPVAPRLTRALRDEASAPERVARRKRRFHV